MLCAPLPLQDGEKYVSVVLSHQVTVVMRHEHRVRTEWEVFGSLGLAQLEVSGVLSLHGDTGRRQPC